MDKELIFKKIDNYIEARKSLWTTVIVLSGGIVGLILTISNLFASISNIVKILIIIIGGLLDYFFILTIIILNKEITNYFILIEKGNKK